MPRRTIDFGCKLTSTNHEYAIGEASKEPCWGPRNFWDEKGRIAEMYGSKICETKIREIHGTHENIKDKILQHSQSKEHKWGVWFRNAMKGNAVICLLVFCPFASTPMTWIYRSYITKNEIKKLCLPSPLPLATSSGTQPSSTCCFIFFRGAPGVSTFLGFRRFILRPVDTLGSNAGMETRESHAITAELEWMRPNDSVD